VTGGWRQSAEEHQQTLASAALEMAYGGISSGGGGGNRSRKWRRKAKSERNMAVAESENQRKRKAKAAKAMKAGTEMKAMSASRRKRQSANQTWRRESHGALCGVHTRCSR